MKPIILTDQQIVEALIRLSRAVESGDSPDGSFEYSMIGPDQWEVKSVYGVGLLEGRNIRRVIGEI